MTCIALIYFYLECSIRKIVCSLCVETCLLIILFFFCYAFFWIFVFCWLVCRCCFVCFFGYVLYVVLLCLSNDSVIFFCYAAGRTCRGYGLQVWCLVMGAFCKFCYVLSIDSIVFYFLFLLCSFLNFRFLLAMFCLFFGYVLFVVLLCFVY
jgi:hypothetical protein